MLFWHEDRLLFWVSVDMKRQILTFVNLVIRSEKAQMNIYGEDF